MSRPRGTGARRSKGCWTCTLRRKKCDETQPACDVCVSRSITCHGYSAEKPDWMRNAGSSEAELRRIQHIVKENRKTQRRMQRERDQAEICNSNQKKISTQPSNWYLMNIGLSVERDDILDISAEPLVHLENGVNQYEPIIHATPAAEGPARTNGPITDMDNMSLIIPEKFESDTSQSEPDQSYHWFSASRGDELRTHYLETVFPLQFRFHIPSGGCGWLLWLLNQTKPLHHAALCLGALHQHSLFDQNRPHLERLKELNKHHERSNQELQAFLRNGYDTVDIVAQRKETLQLLASGMQLISFELFRGGINCWELHLNCLTAILLQRSRDREQDSLGYAVQSPESDTCGNDDARNLEGVAEKFVTGAILWFDIIACASTGRAPRTRDMHNVLLRSGHIDLANIIGCQTWVALLMGEIARIHHEHQEGRADRYQLAEQCATVHKQLESGIKALRRDIDEASTPGKAVHRAVTLVFACATQVYLNVTRLGAYPHYQAIRLSVLDTVIALRDMGDVCDHQSPRSLVWPICIAGSMTDDPALQEYFDRLITDLGDQAHSFGNSKTVLRLIKRCWLHWQKSNNDAYSWFTAMEEENMRVLLV